ncbi:hypothetical protein T12_446 [Trichinella patagoniensis]|uniref:60S ribosomal protein L41 n=1 Tax=Trichinella patagoniensis TaxID=990121 RepID=A0A0V0YPS9_9BILA|nr:hypothetical protein T12_446 [Trichinella patagoniensis]
MRAKWKKKRMRRLKRKRRKMRQRTAYSNLFCGYKLYEEDVSISEPESTTYFSA